jgi:hypothetical protein
MVDFEKVIVTGLLVYIYCIPAGFVLAVCSGLIGGAIGFAVGLILSILVNGYIFSRFWRK